jgi:2-polyprenyl-3-methyl-5-hydroxy-6-metoxy-1,4-benzoquinol methylase
MKTADYYLGKEDKMGHLRNKYVRELYTEDGHPNFQKVMLFMRSLTGEIRKKDILEIGFGRGDLVPILLQDGISSYYGIDFSKHAVEMAKERITDPKVQLENLDAKDINEDKKFDVILLNHVIEHIPVFEMEIVWEKINKILRPGGFIVIQTQLYDNPNSSDKYDQKQETMGLCCHKQTVGTMLRTILQQNYILAKFEDNCFGLVRKQDSQLFSQAEWALFVSTHQGVLRDNKLEMKESYTKEELRKLIPKGGRLLIGCVTENFSPYRDQALKLIKSIRWFGGGTAGANLFVCVVGQADAEFVDELEKWGAFVRVVKPFHKAHPPSNKLRLFELDETDSYDTVMLLDCDTIMVQDPYPYIDGYHFQAEIAAGPSVPHSLFKRLFSHYNLPMLKRKYYTAIHDYTTILYCNAGVLIFPQPLLKRFYPIWKNYTVDLANKKNLLNNHYFFCEQASLSLAFAALPIPFKKLPMKMNFHLWPYPINKLRKCDPVIIHYHRRATKKKIAQNISPSQFAERRIRQFNKKMAKGKI